MENDKFGRMANLECQLVDFASQKYYIVEKVN